MGKNSETSGKEERNDQCNFTERNTPQRKAILLQVTIYIYIGEGEALDGVEMNHIIEEGRGFICPGQRKKS